MSIKEFTQSDVVSLWNKQHKLIPAKYGITEAKPQGHVYPLEQTCRKRNMQRNRDMQDEHSLQIRVRNSEKCMKEEQTGPA